MKKMLFLVSLLSFGIFAGRAQSQAKQDKIKHLFSLMHQDSLLNKSMDAMSTAIASQFTRSAGEAGSGKPPLNAAQYAEIIKTSMEASKTVAQKVLNEDMVSIYDKYFTMDDINHFIAFYQSPAGRHMIERLPDITKDVMTAMMTKYQPMMQQTILEKIQKITGDSTIQQ